ncbi:methyltransferase domain-containing protein [Nonomuraea sp. SMC257]|uniref:Methyltransferase domain-containing protein n=1 Tax=Nonomuraea montanisoli TaxID=2741721 RepID=A0A7Y6IA33_9ACTN|nr:methyltransferase [Nonomuraea montanisoli]NUW34470.1 methyltransferase domain-containing protein [Nonomuraea montanisoli]
MAESRDDDPLWGLIRLGSLHTPMAVRVAATLRLVDHIKDGATGLRELAERTGTDPDALARLIRHLVAVGVLAEPEPGRLAPTAMGEVLADDHPAAQRAWHDLGEIVARADVGFTRLLDAVRTGRPTYADVYGRPFYDDLAAEPRLRESFESLMACDQHVAYDAPTAAYDWSGVRHVCDVGGGTGGFVAAVARAAPHVTATILELPGTAQVARDHLAAEGLADRCDVIEGDFFAPLPCKADVMLLSFVLLNWPDEDAARILARCADSLEPGGRILVYERDDLAENAGNERFTELDLRMLVFLGGRLRTRDAWAGLAARAGLAVESVRRLPNPTIPFDLSLIVLAPAEEVS